jgi:hypothetical protein
VARRVGRRADRGLRQVQPDAVHDQQAQIRERVAECRHLPVEYSPDAVVVAEEDVVEAVVAVDHRGRGRHGQRASQGGVQLVDARKVTAAGRVQLLAEAPQLPVQEPVGPAEVPEPDRRRIHRVQVDERVDQAQHGGPGALGPERQELVGRAVRRARHVLHDVERRAGHRLVLAQQQRLGHRDGRGVQGADHAVLAAHVVCRGEDVAERRPADDPPRSFGSGRVVHHVREVRAAALAHPGLQRPPHQSRQFAVEVSAQPVEVESWRGDLAHRPLLRGSRAVVRRGAAIASAAPLMMPTGRYVVQSRVLWRADRPYE